MQPLQHHQAAALTAAITAFSMCMAFLSTKYLGSSASKTWTIAFVLAFYACAFIPRRRAYSENKMLVLGPVIVLAYLGYGSPRAPAAFETVLSALLVLSIVAWGISTYRMFMQNRRRAARRKAKARARADAPKTVPATATVAMKRPRSRYA